MFLSMQHLRKVYSGNKVAVKDFSLNVKKGEFICFIGTSGSGKTTLLNCISTIDRVTAGKNSKKIFM